MLSVSEIAKIIKSITAREIFKQCPEVKKELWGGSFWSSEYFVNTVSQHVSENVIAQYVRNQGMESNYRKLHEQQLELDLGIGY